MSGIGIITNPHSKLNKRNPARSALLGYILGEQGTLEVTNSLEDLGRVAREFKDKGIGILAINGGDGTISRTLTAFLKEYGERPLPRIVLLRGGTINVLANNLGIRGSPEQILYRLLEAHSTSAGLTTTKVSTLEVEGNFGFLFGNGAASAFLKEYYRRKSGPLGAFLWVSLVWASWFWQGRLYRSVVRDLWFTLRAPDRPSLAHTTCLVFCSTVRRLPLGYPLFNRLAQEAQRFQCFSFCFKAKDAVWQLPYLMLKRQEGTPGTLTFTAERLAVEAEAPFEYTLDGELYTSAKSAVELRIGPELEFITI